MYCSLKTLFLLTVSIAQTTVHATKLSQKEFQVFTGRSLALEQRASGSEGRGGNFYLNIAKGIFNSDKGNLIQNVASIPCDTIETLESDADQAEDFVEQLQAGEVPSIIANLPEEGASVLSDVIGVATGVIDVAEAAVSDVVNVFNQIESGDVEGVATEIVNAITNGWNDFTDEISTAWSDFTCFFDDDCSSSSLAGSCNIPASASATPTPDAGAASSSAAAAAAYTSEFYASESSVAAAAAAASTSGFYASESSAAAGAAYTSEFYASESSAAAAYTSEFYASENSAAAAYTSAYYSSYYASESSAEAADEGTASLDSTATADSITPDTIISVPSETQRQITAPTASQNPAPGSGQSNTPITTQPSQAPQSTPSTQDSSRGSLSFEFDKFNYLALAALAVFAMAIWL